MKPHQSEREASDCPCGRCHPFNRLPRVARPRASEVGLPPKVYDAFISGKAVQDPQGFWWINYAGNCMAPPVMKAHNSESRLLAKRLVRCRKCVECLHARKYYWAMAALEQTKQAKRTWFGTLTFDEWGHAELEYRAKGKHPTPNAAWWSETEPVTYYCRKRKRWVTVDGFPCDERYRVTAREAYREARLYWARLRKAGHNFKYFLVFERHKTGLVHMHFLLHEQDKPILKRELQAQWPWGYSAIKLVGTAGKNPVLPEKAAWYVAKYLSKSEQARQIASKGYRPERVPPKGHRGAKQPVSKAQTHAASPDRTHKEQS